MNSKIKNNMKKYIIKNIFFVVSLFFTFSLWAHNQLSTDLPTLHVIDIKNANYEGIAADTAIKTMHGYCLSQDLQVGDYLFDTNLVLAIKKSIAPYYYKVFFENEVLSFGPQTQIFLPDKKIWQSIENVHDLFSIEKIVGEIELGSCPEYKINIFWKHGQKQ